MKKLLPPQLTFLCLVAMLIGSLWVQQTFAYGIIIRLIGGTVAVFGLYVAIVAKRKFQEVRTNVNTFESPTKLITEGWFRFSRNPMYLGLLVLLIGIALLLNNAWALIGPLVFFGAATFWYIPYEEKDALATFGEPYREYCEAVRRWV